MDRFPLRLGFLASHNGTDIRAIVKAIENGDIRATATSIISNNQNASVREFAQQKGIPFYHISRSTSGSREETDKAIRDILLAHGVNLVILCGYIKRIEKQTLNAFPQRILNVHPSLLPAYAGIYGDRVHQKVLQAKETKTGVTIHSIDEEYDRGKILWQSEVPVFQEDDVESLRNRVQEEEQKAFIKLLQKIQSGELILP